MRIPVYVESRIVEMAGPERAARLSAAPNVTVVRIRKSRTIARLIIRPRVGDDAQMRPGPREDSRVSTYAEEMAPAPMPMMKIVSRDGSMRRWGSGDSFNPFRFNPDALPRTAVEMARR